MIDLESVELFKGLDPRELQAVREIAQERAFGAGAQIFSEGEAGDGVYIIREGLVEIAHLAGGRVRCVFSTLGPREIFGEMSVIEDLPRSATATSAKETRVYFIPRAAMAGLLQRSPVLSFRLLQEISRRLRDFDQLHLRKIIEAERVATLGSFARSIVHDLKTPLTVIGMAADIIASPKTSPDLRNQCLARVKRQITGITEMVGDFLDFTQAQKLGTDMPPMSYRKFIESLISELRAEAELKWALLRLENEPPDVKLRFDPRRIRRVIINLLSNALDVMTNSGQIVLRFRSEGNEIITEVQDEGPGIAPEIADKLFQTFATFGKKHGTGLGLSICKKIMEDHGGRIYARNAPGRGAIFSFALPIPQ